MSFLKDPEVRYVLSADLPIAALTLAGSYHLLNNGADGRLVLLTVALGFALSAAVFLFVMYRHEKNVRRFRAKVNKNLHGHRDLQFNDFREGDFEVLQTDIKKMVVAHYRQEALLEEDRELLKQALADISHQIKTPLTPMTLTAQQLLQDEVSDEERRHAARSLISMIRRLDTLVTALLRISRLDAGATEFRHDTFSAAELVASAVDPLEVLMELKELSYEQQVDEDITIEGDKMWLTEALTNIIKNCIEKTPPGGTIRVEVRKDPIDTTITIRDTGPGIAPEDRPHIFERFYRGSNADSNSFGIGLALTRMIVRGVGGTIKAENHPDGGALFTIKLIESNI